MLAEIFHGRFVQMHIKSLEWVLSSRSCHYEYLSHILKSNPEELHALPHDVLQTLPHDVQMKLNAKTVEWREKNKWLVALLSLWVVVYEKVITPDQDLPPLFTKVASGNPEFSFPTSLMEMVERNKLGNEVDCLRILKLVAKMTTSMMRQKHIYDFSELERLIQSLKDASETMLNLDMFVHLSGGNSGDTLASLVQEAGKLLHPTDEVQQPEDKREKNQKLFGTLRRGNPLQVMSYYSAETVHYYLLLLEPSLGVCVCSVTRDGILSFVIVRA